MEVGRTAWQHLQHEGRADAGRKKLSPNYYAIVVVFTLDSTHDREVLQSRFINLQHSDKKIELKNVRIIGVSIRIKTNIYYCLYNIPSLFLG